MGKEETGRELIQNELGVRGSEYLKPPQIQLAGNLKDCGKIEKESI